MNKIKIKVFVDKESKNLELEFERDSSIKDILNQLKINPETVIISRDNELVMEGEKLNDLDEIKILSVISGG